MEQHVNSICGYSDPEVVVLAAQMHSQLGRLPGLVDLANGALEMRCCTCFEGVSQILLLQAIVYMIMNRKGLQWTCDELKENLGRDISDMVEQVPECGECTTCNLCFEDLVAGTMQYRLPCGHRFHHSACLGNKSIEVWFVTKTTCPVCRTQVPL